MPLRRLAAGLLGAVLLLTLVPLSGAVLSATSQSSGVIGASADWTPPSVSVTGTATLLRGTVEVTAAASDAEGAVRDVRLEVRAAGSTGAWTVLCTDAASPFACAWTTTAVADGAYEVRATATDSAGNVATSAVVQRKVDNLGPVVAVDEAGLPDYLRGTVTVTATASDAGGVAQVRLERSTNGTSWTELCTDTTAPWSCAWATSGTGEAFLRAVATDVTGNTTTSAVVTVALDSTAPTVTAQHPGSPLFGVVTLAATAADADSGVAQVVLEQRAGSTSPWVPVCTATTAPYTCRWDTTTVPNGTTYAFRATATDVAGNASVSAVTATATVDNSAGSVSVVDPGAYLRGTVTLEGTASAPSGVRQVVLQHAPTGTTSWTTVCTDTTAPWTCAWDTTKVAAGSYDVRAVMTTGTGAVLASSPVTGRVVDNAVLRGVDVQASNGGVERTVDAGDRLLLTYDSRVDLTSLLAGWTGEARTVAVRLRDGAAAGGVGGEDVLDVFTTTSLGTAVPLGTVNTRGNYVRGQAMVFSATLSAQTVTVAGQPATQVTLVLGGLTTADNGRVSRSARSMTWTPSAGARDLAGNPASTVAVTETGALDRDF